MNHPLVARLLRPLLVGGVAIVSFATLGQAQTTGTIEGTVTVTGTNQPLPDVQVSLVGTTRGARTDEAGRFRIPGVAAGSYNVRAQRIGYASQSKPLTLAAGQTATLSFVLREAALSLEALVVTGTAAESRKKEVGNATAAIDVKSISMEPVKNTQD